MALWLKSGPPDAYPAVSVYWAASNFDLGLLLDIEASVPQLRAYDAKYPGNRLVRYALAVRLARAHQYAAAAAVYDSIGAAKRAGRMRELARLTSPFEIAQYLASHSEQIYFNDTLWRGYQRYALDAEGESRVTLAEREKLMGDQRWQAYLLLRPLHDRRSRLLAAGVPYRHQHRALWPGR